MTRQELAAHITNRLLRERERFAAEFRQRGRIQSAVIDDLLPTDVAHEIAAAFPKPEHMRELKSLREHKFTAKQLHHFPRILQDVTFAVQDPAVIRVIEQITGAEQMQADPNLYAGGLSLMVHGNFLLPHLDNSHDKNRKLYRVLNLLYYVTPDWKQENGGNLELWDNGPKQRPREIVSAFNRLLLMSTHTSSWHSVNEVRVPGRGRACVSNYYFSPTPLEQHEYFHVTSFRARPDQPARDLFLRADTRVRSAIRSVFKKGIYTPEVFERANASEAEAH